MSMVANAVRACPAARILAFWIWLAWSFSASANDFCTGKAIPFEFYAQQLVGKDWLTEHLQTDAIQSGRSGARGEGSTIALLRSLADLGDVKSRYYYAKILFREKYACEYGPERRLPARTTIEKYLRDASEAGLKEAKFDLLDFYWGDYYRNDEYIPEAIIYLEPRASAGDVFAKVFLARVYECGRGVEKNSAVALGYFASAAIDSAGDYVEREISLHRVARAGVSRLQAVNRASSPNNRCDYLWGY